MVNGLPLIVWVHDAAGQQIMVNDTFCEFFSVTREEMQGGRWQMLMHPDDADGYASEFLAAVGDRRPFHGEVRVKRADGEWRWLESWARPRFDASGEFSGMVGTSADVTERKCADSALESANARIAQQHAHLQAVYDAMNDALFVFDMTGKAVIVNEAAVRAYGGEYPSQSLLEVESFAQAFEIQEPNGATLPLDDWPVSRVLRGERFNRLKLRTRRRDTGQEWMVSFSGEPVRDEFGSQILAVVIARDITERERAEQQLRESEERFRTLADNMSQLAWMADHSGWIFWYNKRWYDYTGSRLDEVQGWGWRDHHHPDHVERVVARIQRSWDTGEPWEDVFPLRGRDGRYRWFLSRALPIRDAEGRIVRWFGTNTDVTEQREAEERLRESDRRKDEYLAMLGHELRNPLAAIQSATDLVKLTAEGGRLERAADVLARQADHMASLVDGLLEVSRIARGKIALDRTVLSLADLCRQAIDDRSEIVSAAGLSLDGELPAEPVWILADRTRLAQIIDNLLGNAVKFTSAPGRICIALEQRDGCAILSIRDSGIGISPEKLEEIFVPFHQESRDVARASGGLGLGLAVTKALVELHDGSIEARSRGPGSGAEFLVRLPLADSPAAEERLVRSDAGVPRRILIVEDNADAAQMLSILLQQRGHRVSVAGDGQEGLELLGREQHEVVLCDIGLPGLSGYEFARRVRGDSSLGTPMLVAVTGYGQREDRMRSTDAGFDAHLVKPVTLEIIDDMLSLMGGRGVDRGLGASARR